MTSRLERYYSQKIKSRRKLEASGARNLWIKDDWRQSFVKIFGFFFWISVVCVWIYHLRFLHFAQVGFAFLIFNYLYIYIFYGGIDNLIYARYDKWHNEKSKQFAIASTSIV
uniref:Uncharacterized protein n=1 Tax=Ditylenchus dipsaci TaxID=166011 RepID=A0A915ED29_9BILA